MTEPQEFCLRWNNHQATIISVFDYLLENETLVDCTLAAEGQYLKAHKVVLCACSPYLEILLSQHNDKHPILIFKDIKYHELKCMIEYMYKGEVNIAQDQLNHFLKAAESLQIKGLSESEEEPAPQTAVPTPRPPPPRAPPVQRTQPRPFSNAVAVRSTGPSEDDVSKRLIGRTEAQSPTPRKRRRQAPLAVQGRSSISGDDASNASEGHFDQSNCDVPTPSHPTPSDSSKAVAKVESSSELMLEPKTEYDDNDNSVEDITLDDDDEDYSQAGTSQMDNSQGNFGAWQQMVGDQTGDEVFSGQESGVQNSQDLSDAFSKFGDLLKTKRRSNENIKLPYTVNGEIYHNCDHCDDFNTTSQTLLHEHVKYYHSDFYCYTNSLFDDKSSLVYSNYHDIVGIMQEYDTLFKNEYLPNNENCVDGVETLIKEEYFESFEKFEAQSQLNFNVTVHKNVFECSLCDEVFVSKTQYTIHLSSKVHIFNDISKNLEPLGSKSDCTSDNDEEEKNKTYVPIDKKVSSKHVNVIPNMTIIEENNKCFNNELCSNNDIVDEKGLKCEICNFKTKNARGMRTHLQRAHKDSVISFTCEKCSFVTKSKSKIKIHYKRYHSDVQFTCTKCQITFQSYENLDDHNKRHMCPQQCELCDKIITGKNMIYFHYYRMHRGYIFKCNQCSFTTTLPKKFIAHSTKYTHLNFEESLKHHDSLTTSRSLIKPRTRSSSVHIESNKNFDVNLKKHSRELRPKYINDNYKCNICNCFLKTQSSLEGHMKKLHSFPCDVCNHVASSLASLNSHKLSHNVATEIKVEQISARKQCSFCYRRFPPYVNMAKHIAVKHSGKLPYTCSICNKRFKNLLTLKSHMNSVHALLYPHSCDICPLRYSDFALLLRHKLRVHSISLKEPVQSHTVGELVHNDSSQSINTVIREKEKEFSCTQCPFQTNNENVLNNHMSLHSLDRRYQCSVCQKRFPTQGVCNAHLRRVHSEFANREYSRSVRKAEVHITDKEIQLELSCNTCKRTFESRTGYTKHMGFHNTRRPAACKICKLRFKTKSDLAHHQKYHKSKHIYVCKKCNWRFARKDSYNCHMKTHEVYQLSTIIHKPEIFTCHHCDFTTNSRESLNAHVKIHDEGKNHICQVCNFTSKCNNVYLQHLNEHKVQEDNLNKKVVKLKLSKWYKCSSCKMSLESFRSLKKHALEKHQLSDVTIFACTCGKVFRCVKYLTAHIRKNHREKDLSKSPMILLSPLKVKVNNVDQTNSATLTDGVLPFKCILCEKVFDKVSLLQNHMYIHNSNTYKCWECGFVCNLASALSAHVSSHTNYLRCIKCDQYFESYESQKRHIQINVATDECTTVT